MEIILLKSSLLKNISKFYHDLTVLSYLFDVFEIMLDLDLS